LAQTYGHGRKAPLQVPLVKSWSVTFLFEKRAPLCRSVYI